MNDHFSYSQVSGRSQAIYDAGLRKFMLSTYNYMSLGIAFTGLVTLWLSVNEVIMRQLSFGFTTFILLAAVWILGFMAPKIILQSRNIASAHLVFWGYALMVSVFIAPLVYYFLNVNGGVQDLAKAFLITAATFAGTSLYGYTTRRNIQGWGGFLVMAIIGLIIASLVNLFLQSTGFALVLSYGIVLFSAAMVAYQTQMLKMQYDHFFRQAGDGAVARLGILGALMLYGSFINIFINVLRIMMLTRNS